MWVPVPLIWRLSLLLPPFQGMGSPLISRVEGHLHYFTPEIRCLVEGKGVGVDGSGDLVTDSWDTIQDPEKRQDKRQPKSLSFRRTWGSFLSRLPRRIQQHPRHGYRPNPSFHGSPGKTPSDITGYFVECGLMIVRTPLPGFEMLVSVTCWGITLEGKVSADSAKIIARSRTFGQEILET